jgi:AraC family transcriptional activator of pobA
VRACGTNLDESNMSGSATRIRSYTLFGESGPAPDVIHCETIEARSVLHDWSFAPHRHARLHQVLLFESGGGTADLDGTAHALRDGVLINVPRDCVHAFRFARGTQGFVATLADDLVEALLADAGEARRELARARVVDAPAHLREDLCRILEEFHARRTARSVVLRGLAATLLGHVARALADAPLRGAGAREPELLRRFKELLETHYAGHWRVADYARALAVTPTHLSRVARGATGEAVSHLIDARVMREARRHLAYTSMSVASIAFALGYSDPAHFSRAFARNVGMSPRRFRAREA